MSVFMVEVENPRPVFSRFPRQKPRSSQSCRRTRPKVLVRTLLGVQIHVRRLRVPHLQSIPLLEVLTGIVFICDASCSFEKLIVVYILTIKYIKYITEGKIKTKKKETMFVKLQLPWNVILPPDSLEKTSLMLQRKILIKLLDEFATKKATKDHGYYLAVTTVDNIGEGKVRQHSGDVLFPVVFSAITFKVFRGEIMEGVVHKVLKHGVFLRCGPIENAYLSNTKMADYKYVPGENAYFMNDKMSKIAKESVVRYIVLGTRWMEADREFQVLVSLEGDYLGPVSSPDI
ncbi:hypothetical protein L6164_003289 [Bauhinia variegata]|uniref:Uncharacterized protein n=2 Tax=Bauhinia variegata TaxID=167791 RepID=A0ACB9Q0U2_BAUVA|nr:hypothetical protein L6164_003289 [Bauhinia variegata]